MTLRSRASDVVVVLAGVVVIGDVRLDHRSRQVHIRADELQRGEAEFEVLALLMEHAGRVVTRTDLVQNPASGGVRPARPWC